MGARGRLRRPPSWKPTDRTMYYLLLGFFSEVNDVFTTPDALHPDNRQKHLGMLYRSWKRVCKEIDPTFDVHTYMAQQKKWGDNE